VTRALVTGGAGFIGYHLSRYLADEGLDVTVLDNFARAEEDAEFEALTRRDNITLAKLDITDPASFEELDGGYDYVYHLAAINGTGNFYRIPDRVLKVGVLGTIHLLDWFKDQGPGKLLFSSSSEAYAGALGLLGDDFPIPTPEDVPLVVDDPSNVRWSYGASKIIGEVALHAWAQAHDMNRFSIIRYHNIYGPRMGFEHVIPQFIERIVKQEDPFRIYGGDATRTFCYVRDAVIATRVVMEAESTDGQVVHVGRSNDEIEITALARKLFQVAGVNPTIAQELVPEGSVRRRCPNTDRLRSLDFEAATSLDEGLRACYEWYAERFSATARAST
jgi:nucleoside-diphosphate-sugar epimerase